LGAHTLTRAPAQARVVYSPRFSSAAALSPAFRASPHLGSLIYPRGAAWRHGLGTLSVWLDALDGPPVLVVPINLEVLLPGMTADGAVTVGFTAATGGALQAHELLSWALWSDRDGAALAAATAGNRPPPQRCVWPCAHVAASRCLRVACVTSARCV
jgi:hypothetical protein